MNPSRTTTVGELLRGLPPEGAPRDAGLQRLTEMYAAGEAVSALRSAALRARETAGTPADLALAEALAAASVLWNGEGALASDANSTADHEQLHRAIASPAFLALVPSWITELRGIAATRPGTGACTVATALQLWLWTASHFRNAPERRGAVMSELADVFCWLLAARSQILENAPRADAQDFASDLCHVQAARSAGAVATLCAELVFGYRSHPAWNAEGCSACYQADDLDTLEGWIPGLASSARAHDDVIESDGSHAAKAGPCAKADGLETFIRLRAKLDGCLTGARLAKDRAAAALPRVMAASTN
jgi:hypothetical protein